MEVKNDEGPGLASKRGSDLNPSAVAAAIELKKQKLEIPEEGEGKKISETLDEEQIVTATKSEKVVEEEGEGEEEEAVAEAKVESERAEEDGDSNGKAVIDRKGKGILIEEEEDDEEEDEGDDSDDLSDGGNVSQDGGDDSDFSDDPLAEVDLDNILPSRTRRRVVHPSAYIANDLVGANADDDSDDSDA